MLKEVKLTINGKEVQLTDEQKEALYEEHHKCENPFEKEVDGMYFYIDPGSHVHSYIDHNDAADKELYDNCNYFKNRRLAEQVALHQLLYRKLLKFAYENDCIDTAEWNSENDHWCIHYNCNLHKFESYPWQSFRFVHGIFFSSEEAAKQAIKEVVKPFMIENPEFVW